MQIDMIYDYVPSLLSESAEDVVAVQLFPLYCWL